MESVTEQLRAAQCRNIKTTRKTLTMQLQTWWAVLRHDSARTVQNAIRDQQQSGRCNERAALSQAAEQEALYFR
jgi:hypothetical protein